MIEAFNIDYQQVYQFYVLQNTTYYLRRYMEQPMLHEQVYWLLDTWLAALQAITYSTPTLKEIPKKLVEK